MYKSGESIRRERVPWLSCGMRETDIISANSLVVWEVMTCRTLPDLVGVCVCVNHNNIINYKHISFNIHESCDCDLRFPWVY